MITDAVPPDADAMFGAALRRTAAASGRGGPRPEALLRAPVPGDPLGFAAAARRRGVDPFLLLWLVNPPMAEASVRWAP